MTSCAGGRGDDHLYSLGGSDWLKGGIGSDSFVFSRHWDDGDVSQIADYKSNDTIYVALQDDQSLSVSNSDGYALISVDDVIQIVVRDFSGGLAADDILIIG